MQFYQINAGHLAVDNGSIAPLSALFALGDILDQKVISGEYYGQDFLIVPEDPEIRTIAEELMTERKLIWKVVDELPYWLRGYVV